jgi:hypothetical protein
MRRQRGELAKCQPCQLGLRCSHDHYKSKNKIQLLWFHRYVETCFIKRAFKMTVPWLRRLVAGLSPRRPGFDLGSVHEGFVVDKVELDRFFSEYFGFPLSMLH